jgi:hypothetical protein
MNQSIKNQQADKHQQPADDLPSSERQLHHLPTSDRTIRRAGHWVEPYRHRPWILGHAAESSDLSSEPLPQDHVRPVERVAGKAMKTSVTNSPCKVKRRTRRRARRRMDPYGFREIATSATAAEAPVEATLRIAQATDYLPVLIISTVPDERLWASAQVLTAYWCVNGSLTLC